MSKLWKLILAVMAIVVTIHAIYLPFRLQKLYNRVAALVAYKLKALKFITNLIIEKERKYDER